MVEPHDLVAHFLGERERVGHECHGGPGVAQFAHVVEALALEFFVAHGDDLVDDEDLGADGHGHGEAQANRHSR